MTKTRNRSKRGGQMMMNFNQGIIPDYSPISSKGGSKRRKKSKISKTRRNRKRNRN